MPRRNQSPAGRKLGALGSVREELSGNLEESELEEDKRSPEPEEENLRHIDVPAGRHFHPRKGPGSNRGK